MKEKLKIEDQIIDRLGKLGRGRIFFAQEFYDLWPESSVRFADCPAGQRGVLFSRTFRIRNEDDSSGHRHDSARDS